MFSILSDTVTHFCQCFVKVMKCLCFVSFYCSLRAARSEAGILGDGDFYVYWESHVVWLWGLGQLLISVSTPLSFSKASVILILQLALLQQVQSDFRLGYISVNIKEILSPERTVQYYSLILFLNSWPFQELILSPPQFALENHVAFFVVPRRVFGNKTKTRK